MDKELLTAQQLIDSMRSHWEGRTYADIGRELGLNDEVVRMTVLGHREPARSFLAALGYERVLRYRKKTDADPR
jgi:hypothetical protein